MFPLLLYQHDTFFASWFSKPKIFSTWSLGEKFVNPHTKGIGHFMSLIHDWLALLFQRDRIGESYKETDFGSILWSKQREWNGMYYIYTKSCAGYFTPLTKLHNSLWGGSPEWLNIFPKVTQLGKERVRIWSQICLTPGLSFFTMQWKTLLRVKGHLPGLLQRGFYIWKQIINTTNKNSPKHTAYTISLLITIISAGFYYYL